MPIPVEIREVPRPRNSIVIAYGKNKDLYAVRKRVGCKYVNGKRRPINGPTIGHIVNGKYIPIPEDEPEKVSSNLVDLKGWGNIILGDNLFKNVMQELRAVYSREDAEKLYCISMLRVFNKGIKNNELKEEYDDSFLSELYPNVALSKNTVSTFLNNIGKNYSRIVKFMQNRTALVSLDHHLLIDGTLKTNDSVVNTLSDYSRKAKIKGRRDISVLFAFDLEEMEPVCSKCFPGNMLDVTAYEEFITQNNITKGIIVADKGFPESAAHEHFENNKDLHYLNPIKRNSKLIERHKMLNFEAMLPGYEGISYKKEKCVGINKWLYSFRSVDKASKEDKDWHKRAKKNDTYSFEEYCKKNKSFGTIVLECDLDLPPEIVYKAYEKRWEIEIVMRFYKSACEFDDTRVHDDYSVIGSEFCDFLSTILTFRLIKAFDKANLLFNHTYGKLMSILNRAKKVRIDDGEWHLIRINPSYLKILEALELIPKQETKKKINNSSRNKNNQTESDGNNATQPSSKCDSSLESKNNSKETCIDLSSQHKDSQKQRLTSESKKVPTDSSSPLQENDSSEEIS